MRVADFFCGAGGFSEGFRQAGFDVCFAVDKWIPAVNTYRANKPHCNVILDNVIRISTLSDDEFNALVPDTEVIIGSPPCVAFSNSNKSGKGDKTLGIELIKAYLRIIARKKYKENSILCYWVLENVPNIRRYLQDQYSPSDLGLAGNFSLTVINESSGIYNAKYYGAPTNRKRFLCGEFPIPQKTNDDDNVISLGRVLESLGSPLDQEKQIVSDCNYPDFTLPRDEVTDHQYIYRLQPFEWKIAKRLKEDKGYMGKMSFPENLDNPARTVMANMSSSSRESMILSTNDGGYRLPTVREAASMMSFPIDYKFYGESKGIKHTLVGNSVPPKMSYAIARAIALDANEPIKQEYTPIQHDDIIPFIDLNYSEFRPKAEQSKRDISKFKYHIPYIKINAYRVELTNYHSNFEKKKFRWTAEIHYSQGKDKAKVYRPRKVENQIPRGLIASIDQYMAKIHPNLCSFNDFQRVFCLTELQRKEQKLVGPYELLDSIREFISSLVIPEELVSKVSNDLPKIPTAILVGYYILNQITKEMRDIRNGCGY
jgi:DNA (cytosine-5)-methyltransferase 1